MIGNTNITEDIVRELKYLSERIDKNIANREDYHRYHKLLNDSGIDDELIRKKLAKFNINNIEEFYKQRSQNQQPTEGAVLGAVLGLALVVLFFWAIGQNKKSS